MDNTINEKINLVNNIVDNIDNELQKGESVSKISNYLLRGVNLMKPDEHPQVRLHTLNVIGNLLRERSIPLSDFLFRTMWTNMKDVFTISKSVEEKEAGAQFLNSMMQVDFKMNTNSMLMREMVSAIYSLDVDFSIRIDCLRNILKDGNRVSFFDFNKILRILEEWIMVSRASIEKHDQIAHHVAECMDFLKSIVCDHKLKFIPDDVNALYSLLARYLCNQCKTAKRIDHLETGNTNLYVHRNFKAASKDAFDIFSFLLSKGYITKSNTTFITSILCCTVRIHSLASKSKTWMDRLLRSNIGKLFFQKLLHILTQNPFDNFYVGAIYFVSNGSWGVKPYAEWEPYTSVVLKAFEHVINHCRNIDVLTELLMSIRRLLKITRGKQMDILYEWSSILVILGHIGIYTLKEDELMKSKSHSLSTTMQEALEHLIHIAMDKRYYGDSNELFTLLHNHKKLILPEHIIYILELKVHAIHPSSHHWLADIEMLFQYYFQNEPKNDIKLFILGFIQNLLKSYGNMFCEDILVTILPHIEMVFQNAKPTTHVDEFLVEVLNFLNKMATEMRVSEKTFASICTILTNAMNTKRAVIEICACSYLLQVFKEKFSTLPCTEAPIVFKQLVSGLKHKSIQVRMKILAVLKSLKANSYYQLSLDGQVSPYLYCASQSYHTGSIIYILNISTYISQLLSLLKSEKDSEMMVMTLEAIRGIVENIYICKDFAMDILCQGMADHWTSRKHKINKSPKLLMIWFQIFTMLMCYGNYISKRIGSTLVSCLVEGVLYHSNSKYVDSNVLTTGINSLSMCCLEYPHEFFKHDKLIIEFIEDVRVRGEKKDKIFDRSVIVSVFWLLHYISKVEDEQLSKFTHTAFNFSIVFIKKKKYSQHVRVMAYHMIMVWFLQCSFATRKSILMFLLKDMTHEMNNEYSVHAETAIDFLMKFTFISCEQSFEMNDNLRHLFDDMEYRAWSLGNGILTCQVGKFGHVLLRYRRPTGTIAWTMRLVNNLFKSITMDELLDEEINSYFGKYPNFRIRDDPMAHQVDTHARSLSRDTPVNDWEALNMSSARDISSSLLSSSPSNSPNSTQPLSNYFDPVIIHADEDAHLFPKGNTLLDWEEEESQTRYDTIMDKTQDELEQYDFNRNASTTSGQLKELLIDAEDTPSADASPVESTRPRRNTTHSHKPSSHLPTPPPFIRTKSTTSLQPEHSHPPSSHQPSRMETSRPRVESSFPKDTSKHPHPSYLSASHQPQSPLSPNQPKKEVYQQEEPYQPPKVEGVSSFEFLPDPVTLLDNVTSPSAAKEPPSPNVFMNPSAQNSDGSILHPNFPYLFLRNWSFLSQEPAKSIRYCSELTRDLELLDLTPNLESLTVGVVFVHANQQTQREILLNLHGSSRYFELLKNLGNFVPLVNLPKHFVRDLDPSVADYLLSYKDELIHMAFHTATLMKNTDAEGYTKLRYIGNDAILIVYKDSDDTPWDMNRIGSQLCYFQIVIVPLEHGMNKVRLLIKPEFANQFHPYFDSMTSHAHLVRDASLPQFVQNTVVHAMLSIRSFMHDANKVSSNWHARLKRIRRIKDNFCYDSNLQDLPLNMVSLGLEFS